MMAASNDADGECIPTLSTALPPTLTLLTATTTLLIVTITLTHTLSGRPLRQLGVRPPGRGLWSYLGGQLRGGIGTLGYDSSLGSHSPLVRVLFHICAFLAIWASLICGPVWVTTLTGFYNGIGGDDATKMMYCTTALSITSASVLSDGIVAAAAYFGGLFLYHMVTPGVSHPGGPREHKIRRMPTWDDVTTHAVTAMKENSAKEQKAEVKWRCAVAEDSHDVTLKRFGVSEAAAKDDDSNNDSSNNDDAAVKLGMTGEPAGRQMWTWSPKKVGSGGGTGGGGAGDVLRQILTPTRKSGGAPAAVDEKLVEEMACGGRPAGFNPSVNPNR